jgi:hypothetical protein
MDKNTRKKRKSVNYLLGAFSVCAVAFYVICGTPGYGWRDGPELAVTAAFLDVAHPSGFPTFNLLAKILTWLPFGTLAFRVTIFTALAGGASVFLLGLLLRQLHDLDEAKPNYFFLLVPLFFFAFHQSFFIASTEVEVYSLNSALLISLLLCALKWRCGYGIVWLYIGGFLYGLACGNHASLALYLPVLLLLTFWTWPKNGKATDFRGHLVKLSLLSVFFLVGISVYLFLLVRSQTDRLPVDFGRTNTWARLWMHISDAKDTEYHFKGLLNYRELFYLLNLQFQKLSSPLVWIGMPFFLWGLKYLWKKYQILSVALIVLIGINFFFFYYWMDGTSAFIPVLICFFLLVCLGLGQFGRVLAKYPTLKILASTVLLFFLVPTGFIAMSQRYDDSDRESGFWSTELFLPDLAQLPPDSIAIHHSQWFFELGLHNLYFIRPDVSLILLSGIVQPQFFCPPVQAKTPRLIFPLLRDGTPLPPETPGYFNYLIVPNMDAGKPVYLQYGRDVVSLFNYMSPAMPLQWMGKLNKDKWMFTKEIQNGNYNAYLAWLRDYMAKLATSVDPPLANKAPVFLYYMSDPIFRVVASKFPQESILTVKSFLTYFSRPDGTVMLPHDVILNLHYFLVDTYRLEKDYTEAIKYAEALISYAPFKAYSYFLLGLIYNNQHKKNEMLAAWKMATTLDIYEMKFIYNYYLALAKYNSISEAVTFLEIRAQELERDNAAHLRDLVLKFRDCLLLPPEEIGYLDDFGFTNDN